MRDAPPATPLAAACYHCGQPIPPGIELAAEVAGAPRAMCCHGCVAVAAAIVEAGLVDYYRFRTEAAPQGRELVPEALRELAAWDHPAVARELVHPAGGGCETALLLEDLTCAACVWLTEQRLARVDGVQAVQVNFATRRATVRFDPERTSLSKLLAAVAAVGFRAHPYDAERARSLVEAERRDRLLRWLVAGALGMQVMTLAVALYAGAFSGIEQEFASFFRWVSLLLTAPILLYSARPFFVAAFRDLTHRRVGMDVPVSLGLTLAYGGSVWATVTGQGEVWFDSVAMFVFFLLGARVLELSARARAVRELEALLRQTPTLARRIAADGSETRVPTAELAAGDTIRVLPGETVPADGVITAGRSSLDEALLTGESVPVPRGPGDRVVGGAINAESPLLVVVEAVGEATVLASLRRLVEHAQDVKPRLAQLADKVARVFVAAVLVIAAVVALGWWWADPSHLLPTVIAVLVVSCPCALSLATPVALAVASGALGRRGLLVTRAPAIELLDRADVVVLDKTGTLTSGELAVERVVSADPQAALAVAAALEQGSEHPIARAVLRAARAAGLAPPAADDLRNHPGRGLVGTLDGVLHAVGTPELVASTLGLPLTDGPPFSALAASGCTVVAVGRAAPAGATWLGTLLLRDTPRPAAAGLVRALTAAGRRVVLLSGDQPAAVAAAAAAAGITDHEGAATPERKLARIRALADDGSVVAMVGDGLNDAGALGAATVSVAMGSGADLAASTADAILLSDDLDDLAFAFAHARKTMRVLRQNFLRTVLYNLVVIPLAACGQIPPWLAAIGMSASSAMVVANALRLRLRDGHPAGDAGAAGPAGSLAPALELPATPLPTR
jgi:Cu2+-exporting ATPase